MESERFFQRAASMFRHPERKSGVAVIKLFDDENYDKFEEAVTAAQGRALFVVHPYFYEHDTNIPRKLRKDKQYKSYKKALTSAVTKAAHEHIPLVILEQEKDMNNLAGTVANMGRRTGEVFSVATQNASPEPTLPYSGGLWRMIDKMKDAGLTDAEVAGSYINLVNGDFEECVGGLINRLIEYGVNTTVTDAVFSRAGNNPMASN